MYVVFSITVFFLSLCENLYCDHMNTALVCIFCHKRMYNNDYGNWNMNISGVTLNWAKCIRMSLMLWAVVWAEGAPIPSTSFIYVRLCYFLGLEVKSF